MNYKKNVVFSFDLLKHLEDKRLFPMLPVSSDAEDVHVKQRDDSCVCCHSTFVLQLHQSLTFISSDLCVKSTSQLDSTVLILVLLLKGPVLRLFLFLHLKASLLEPERPIACLCFHPNEGTFLVFSLLRARGETGARTERMALLHRIALRRSLNASPPPTCAAGRLTPLPG